MTIHTKQVVMTILVSVWNEVLFEHIELVKYILAGSSFININNLFVTYGCNVGKILHIVIHYVSHFLLQFYQTVFLIVF